MSLFSIELALKRSFLTPLWKFFRYSYAKVLLHHFTKRVHRTSFSIWCDILRLPRLVHSTCLIDQRPLCGFHRKFSEQQPRCDAENRLESLQVYSRLVFSFSHLVTSELRFALPSFVVSFPWSHQILIWTPFCSDSRDQIHVASGLLVSPPTFTDEPE